MLFCFQGISLLDHLSIPIIEMSKIERNQKVGHYYASSFQPQVSLRKKKKKPKKRKTQVKALTGGLFVAELHLEVWLSAWFSLMFLKINKLLKTNQKLAQLRVDVKKNAFADKSGSTRRKNGSAQKLIKKSSYSGK